MSRLKVASFAMGVIAAAGLAFAALAQPPAAPAAPAAKPAPIDYSKPETWLCRPGLAGGPCLSDQTATEVAADGGLKSVNFTRPAAPAFDCFYVYPTASEDATPNSDMIPGREIAVTTAQFGRFGAVCRQFAPMYRSVTLAALRAGMAGSNMPGVDRELNYNDMKDAWNYYLKNDNKGRGVILVGHSQGAGLLSRLIANEIEGKPAQRLIISAMIPGTTVQVPVGKTVGGTFKSMPLCTKASEAGCIVVFSSFRSTRPPSVEPPSRFARARDGNVASCANPAALGGGKASLDAYQTKGTTDWSKGKPVSTPYVRLPGLITGECVTKGEYTYLQITVNGVPADPRADDISGDVGTPPDPTWGLHNGDMAVAIGDMVKLADSQAKAWKAKP
ncbi:DUF3089 domain-containing protein [soil metagenome]